MKRFNLLILAGTLIGAPCSFAESPINPCAPSVVADSTRIHCSSESGPVSIIFQTLMSPETDACKGANYHESIVATLTLSTPGQAGSNFVLQDSEFTYTFGHMSSGRFDSERADIHLKGCFNPAIGGASFGN